MTDSATPICDLIESLLSHGCPTGTALEQARDIEARLMRVIGDKRLIEQRKYERVRKRKYRAKTAEMSPDCPGGTSASIYTGSKVDSVSKEGSKKASEILHGEGTGELFESPSVEKPKGDWPKNYRDLFWACYPRRVGKAAATRKLEALQRSGKVPWEKLMAGVGRYVKYTAGTEEQFIKHPATWLNQGCWDDEHKASGGYNGKARGPDERIGWAGFAAKIRYGGASFRRDADAASGEGLAGGRGDSEDGDERMARGGQAALPSPRIVR
jgi:hypothetical protein